MVPGSLTRPLLLVTGAAGRVGTALREHLLPTHDLRLFDRLPSPDPRPGETVMVGDLAVYEDVAAAVDGVAAVLHLACVHGLELRFEDSIDANYRGTVNLLDAMRAAAVKRLVYASSHHVLGLHPLEGFQGDLAELAPDAFYGLGKAFGEIACGMYARRYGVSTLMIRIGNADPQVSDARSLRLWTSARDLGQLVNIGLSHHDIGRVDQSRVDQSRVDQGRDDQGRVDQGRVDQGRDVSSRHDLGYDVVYGVSRCAEPLFANRRAHELGYRPQDIAEQNLASDYLSYEEMPARLGRDHVGGGYAVVDLPRPEEHR